MVSWPYFVITFVTWGISFDEMSVSLDCCETGLWYPINTNYVFKAMHGVSQNRFTFCMVQCSIDFLANKGAIISNNISQSNAQYKNVEQTYSY